VVAGTTTAVVSGFTVGTVGATCAAAVVGSAVGATAAGAKAAGGKAGGRELLQATANIRTTTRLNFSNKGFINYPDIPIF